MVPFFAYGILYHVLCLGIVVPMLRGGADWALCRDNILGLLVQLRGTDLVAPKWFLTAAFVASVLFYALRKYVHDRRIEFPVVLAVSAGVAYLNKFTGFSLPWYIDVSFPCVLFMYLGQYVREKNVEIGGWRIAVLSLTGVVCAAALTVLLAGSGERFPVDYHMMHLTPFALILLGGFALCLALYGALKNVKKKSILSYITMLQPDSVFSCFDQLVIQNPRQCYRTVFAPRTSDCDDKTCLAFFCIIRNQEFYHIVKLCCKLPCNFIIHYIIEHAFILSRQRPKFVHIIWIRQKTHIKNQIGIRRDSIFKSER